MNSFWSWFWLLLAALAALFMAGMLTGCTQQQLAAAQADAVVACRDAETGEVVSATIDPALLTDPDDQKVQSAVALACSAVNATPAPGSVPVPK